MSTHSHSRDAEPLPGAGEPLTVAAAAGLVGVAVAEGAGAEVVALTDG